MEQPLSSEPVRTDAFTYIMEASAAMRGISEVMRSNGQPQQAIFDALTLEVQTFLSESLHYQKLLTVESFHLFCLGEDGVIGWHAGRESGILVDAMFLEGYMPSFDYPDEAEASAGLVLVLLHPDYEYDPSQRHQMLAEGKIIIVPVDSMSFFAAYDYQTMVKGLKMENYALNELYREPGLSEAEMVARIRLYLEALYDQFEHIHQAVMVRADDFVALDNRGKFVRLDVPIIEGCVEGFNFVVYKSEASLGGLMMKLSVPLTDELHTWAKERELAVIKGSDGVDCLVVRFPVATDFTLESPNRSFS